MEDNADEFNVPQFKTMARSVRRTEKIDMMVEVAVRGKLEFDRTGLNTASSVLFYLAQRCLINSGSLHVHMAGGLCVRD